MRILLALDGTDEGLGAARMALALSKRPPREVEVRVLVVLDPPAEDLTGTVIRLPTREEERSRVVGVRERVRGVLEAAGAGSVGWPIHPARGPVPRTITRTATRWGCHLIVLGTGRRRPIDRVLGDDVAVRVVRLSRVPVLAVPGGASGAPRAVTVGLDLSPPSVAVAELAASLFPSRPPLHLVHVLPAGLPGAPAGAEAELRGSLLEQLDPLSAELSASGGRVGSVRLPVGDPADTLLATGAETGSDLLAVGSHGRGFLGRTLLGSVAEKLLRSWEGSLLVVPPRGRSARNGPTDPGASP